MNAKPIHATNKIAVWKTMAGETSTMQCDKLDVTKDMPPHIACMRTISQHWVIHTIQL